MIAIYVYHSRQWGTVCHHYFDMNDAKVSCRQLGLTKAVGHWRYGRGTGKVWLNWMQCSGTETSLQSCSHDGWGNVAGCDHTSDVGVVCSVWQTSIMIRICIINNNLSFILFRLLFGLFRT